MEECYKERNEEDGNENDGDGDSDGSGGGSSDDDCDNPMVGIRFFPESLSFPQFPPLWTTDVRVLS